jgi:endonuclease/exonuclease/phosphatase family metal-dependent hydrolase
VTFNILHGRSPEDGRVDVDRFAAAIKGLDADILALQEVDRDQPRSELADFTQVAAEAMGAIDHRFVAALAGTPGATWMAATGEEQPGTATYGIALLSRCPTTTWQVTRMPAPPVHFPMWLREPRKMIMVREEPRVAVAATLQTPLGELTVVNTHLSYVPGWRRWQLRRLTRDLAELPGPLILAGDLNMTARPAGRITGYRALASGDTFPAHAPCRQLDHILLRGHLPGAATGRPLRLPVSDHQALVTDFSAA